MSWVTHAIMIMQSLYTEQLLSMIIRLSTLDNNKVLPYPALKNKHGNKERRQKETIYIYLVLFVLQVAHKASTRARQRCRSAETRSRRPHVQPFSFISLSTVLLQVSLGRPLFLWPSGVHRRAILVKAVVCWRSTCPIHRQRLRLTEGNKPNQRKPAQDSGPKDKHPYHQYLRDSDFRGELHCFQSPLQPCQQTGCSISVRLNKHTCILGRYRWKHPVSLTRKNTTAKKQSSHPHPPIPPRKTITTT